MTGILSKRFGQNNISERLKFDENSPVFGLQKTRFIEIFSFQRRSVDGIYAIHNKIMKQIVFKRSPL